MSSLRFGTSGLRGLVEDLVGWPSYAHTLAFLTSAGKPTRGQPLLIGRDLRASSPAIAAAVAAAARDAGVRALDCGPLPTPALALESLRLGAPAVMVTGSHIPEDRNGLKFYTAAGEITKADETAILAALPATRTVDLSAEAELYPEALQNYRNRCVEAFGPEALAGLRVGVYQQSSVARDLLVDILAALGAEPVPFGRADRFIPVDTEAHRPEDLDILRQTAARDGRLDAIVTTDGDADRPLLADGAGTVLRGDVLCLMAARELGITAVAVPVTAGSAVERCGFARVVRTRVGSPYVIAGMGDAARETGTRVAGFEANGGFLLGSDVVRNGRTITALPTRDSALPVLATLAACRTSGQPLAALVTALGAGFAASNRLKDVAPEQSGPFMTALGDEDVRTRFFAPIGAVAGVDTRDGVKAEFNNGATIHFRVSGNAPELRCYAEAETAEEAERLVAWGLEAAAATMHSAAVS